MRLPPIRPGIFLPLNTRPASCQQKSPAATLSSTITRHLLSQVSHTTSKGCAYTALIVLTTYIHVCWVQLSQISQTCDWPIAPVPRWFFETPCVAGMPAYIYSEPMTYTIYMIESIGWNCWFFRQIITTNRLPAKLCRFMTPAKPFPLPVPHTSKYCPGTKWRTSSTVPVSSMQSGVTRNSHSLYFAAQQRTKHDLYGRLASDLQYKTDLRSTFKCLKWPICAFLIVFMLGHPAPTFCQHICT